MPGNDVSIGDIIMYKKLCGDTVLLGHVIDFVGTHYDVRILSGKRKGLDMVYPRDVIRIVSAVYGGRKRI